jgi:hypothetical protein
MNAPLRIIYCHCAYAHVVPKDVKEAVLRQLLDANVNFDCAADLCEMSAKRDPLLKELAGQANVKIAACYPRAVRWLFAAAEAPLGEGVEVLNMRTQTADQIVAGLLGRMTAADVAVASEEAPMALAAAAAADVREGP